MNGVPFRSSFEPTFSAVLRRVGAGDERFAAAGGGEEAALRDLRPGDDAHRRVRLVDAADRVRGRRDVRLRRIEHLLQRLRRGRELRAELRRLFGRHFANAPRSNPPPPPPPKPPPPLPSATAVAVEPPEPPFCERSLSKQACIAANCAAVGRGRLRRIWKVCPPVFSLATIFGTTPSWCSASSVRPCVTCATPAIDAICFAADCWNVSCVPGRKKSWTKCVPGLPSFDRSVITDWFARTRSRLPPPPPPGPPKPPP